MFEAGKYTVGWICALPVEAVAALALLDEEHEVVPEVSQHDNNSYSLGRIGHHNIVIAVLPDGEYGTTSAATVASNLLHSFPNVRIGIMVGIGGGAPSKEHDIRLGDVVVSSRDRGLGGVFQYDYGKLVQNQDKPFEHTGFLDQPPSALRTAVAALKSRYKMKGHHLNESLQKALEKWPRLKEEYSRPAASSDNCYKSSFIHPDDSRTCEEVCGADVEKLKMRKRRQDNPDEPVIHYGLVASGNSLMKNAMIRTKLAKEAGVLCFEMEAAGLMNHFPCLNIRGICDYSDSHKNKLWQGYAAMAAAIYAKEVLSMVPAGKVAVEKRIAETLRIANVQNVSEDGRAWQTNVSGGTNHLYQGDHTTIQHNYGEVTIRQAVQEQVKESDCLNAFKTEINYVIHKDRNGVCAPDTGQWFFHHPEFEAFQKGKGPQLLFVTAEAGGGKSTTLRTLIDRLQASGEPPVIAYFFFKDDDDRLRSYDAALSTLAYQLLVQEKNMEQHVKPLYQEYGDAIRHQTKEIWKLILEIASKSSRDVFCVLDAVDECAPADRKQLIADLAEVFQNQAISTARLKFVISSRPYEDESHPYENLEKSSNIKVLAGENAQVVSDIRKVIRYKAAELARKRQLSQHIEEILVSKLSDQNIRTRSFLAVRMAFELLDSHHRMHKGAGERTIEVILSSIPQQLSDQFDEMLERSHDKGHTWKMFCVILAARKTLKIAEFKVIYALTQPASSNLGPPRSYDQLELPTDDEEFKRFVRSRCGLFITFIRDSVHLFHQTAREHLLARLDTFESKAYTSPLHLWDAQNPPAGRRARRSWKYSISLSDANIVCATVCLDILTFDVPLKSILEIFDTLAVGGGFFNDMKDFASSKPFFLYAAYNWHEHIVLGGSHASKLLSTARYACMLDISKPSFWVWFLALSNYINTNSQRSKAIISNAWVAAEKSRSLSGGYGPFLREDCLEVLFSMDKDVHILLGQPTSALWSSEADGPQWQAEDGYHLIDAFHLAYGEYEFTTASQAVQSMEQGDQERGSILAAEQPLTVLIWACITESAPKALRQVLSSATDLNWLHDVPEQFVYRRQIMRGSSSISGKDLREKREMVWTKPWPQTCAIMFKQGIKCSPATVQMFEALADWMEASPFASDYAQMLWEAGGFFHRPLCRRLIDSGASINCKLWNDQRTALQVAASFWEHDLVQLLLDLGADPSICSPNGYTILHWFLRPEEPFVGDDPKAVKSTRRRRQEQIGQPRYRKSLIAATVKALVQSVSTGAPLIDKPNNDGSTPLMFAARYSPTATKALLDEGAEIEKRDAKGRTALMYFFTRGFNGRSVRILKYLLDAGADSQAGNSNKRTVFGFWAAKVLHQKLSNFYPGSNSLNKAFHQLHTVGPLSDRNAMVKEVSRLNIPLVVAARLGNAQLCQVILESGAHPDRHGIAANSSIGENSGSVSSDLEDLAWNPILVALWSKAYVTAAMLLAYGADLNYEVPTRKRTKYNKYHIQKGGLTPLHLAVGGNDSSDWSRHPNIVLSSGGSFDCAFNAATKPQHPVMKRSPIETLSKHQRAQYAKFKAREYDVDSSDPEYEIHRFVFTNDSTKASKTPFDTLFGAPMSPNLTLEPLLDVMINKHNTPPKRQTALVEYMLQKGASINTMTQAGITPLMASVSQGRLELTEMLLKYGADPNLTANGGCTPLMIAARDGRRRLIDILVASGASLDAQLNAIAPEECSCRNFVEWSRWPFQSCYAPLNALAIAAERSHQDVVESLLKHGADPNLPIVHHAHGKSPSKRDRRRIHRHNQVESSDSESEPELPRWNGCFAIGTALTWARGDVRELLLRHGADPMREEALRKCDCLVIEPIETSRSWGNGGSDDDYPTHEESGSDTDLPWRRRRSKLQRPKKGSSSESL